MSARVATGHGTTRRNGDGHRPVESGRWFRTAVDERPPGDCVVLDEERRSRCRQACMTNRSDVGWKRQPDPAWAASDGDENVWLCVHDHRATVCQPRGRRRPVVPGGTSRARAGAPCPTTSLSVGSRSVRCATPAFATGSQGPAPRDPDSACHRADQTGHGERGCRRGRTAGRDRARRPRHRPGPARRARRLAGGARRRRPALRTGRGPARPRLRGTGRAPVVSYR